MAKKMFCAELSPFTLCHGALKIDHIKTGNHTKNPNTMVDKPKLFASKFTPKPLLKSVKRRTLLFEIAIICAQKFYKNYR